MPPTWVTQAFTGSCCLPIGALEDSQVNIQQGAPPTLASQSHPLVSVSPPKDRNEPLPSLSLQPSRKSPSKKLQKFSTQSLLQNVDRTSLLNFLPPDQYHKIITIRRPPYNKNYVVVVARFSLDSKRSYIASKVLDQLGNERTKRKIVCACPCSNCPHRNQKKNMAGSKDEGNCQLNITGEEMEDMGKVTLDWADDEPDKVDRKMKKLGKEEKRVKCMANFKKVFSLKKSPENKSKRKGMDIKGKGVDRDDMTEMELQPVECTDGEIKIEPSQKAIITVGGALPHKEAEIWHRGIFYVVEGSEVEPGIEMVLNNNHAAKIQGLLDLEVESTTQVKQEIVDSKTGEVTENSIEVVGLMPNDPDPSYQSIFGRPEP